MDKFYPIVFAVKSYMYYILICKKVFFCNPLTRPLPALISGRMCWKVKWEKLELESKDFECGGNRKYLTGIEPKTKRIQAQFQFGYGFIYIIWD
jgi:hypothetical protein